MGVFKDDRLVAKVLGNQPQPINQNDRAKRYALFGAAALIVALAAFAIYGQRSAVVPAISVANAVVPVNAKPMAAAAALSISDSPAAVFSAAPVVKKLLPPVIEDARAEATELTLREISALKKPVRLTEAPLNIPANKLPTAFKSAAPASLLDDARQIDAAANGDFAQLEKARALYQQALESGKLENADERSLARLNELTVKLILDPKARCSEPKALFHKVESGDVVEKIAKKYKVNQGQIKRVNHLNERLNVRLGQTLKLLPGDVVFKVDKENLSGTLYIDNVFIRRYPVGIGPGNATPKGSFSVENKVMNPDWYYEGKKVPFGDPENILGTRWIGLAGTYGSNGAGLGVHGTAMPQSVPGRESKGCVRMHNEDVEELYDFMPQGGKVVIE